MTQLAAVVSPDEAPEAHADGRVALVSADGEDVNSAPVGIKTRASGCNIEISIDRSVTLRGVGRMSAVEVRGSHGERYIFKPLPVTLYAGDRVVASPGW